MRSRSEVHVVLRLVAQGFNDCEISQETGVPRRTVLDWRHRRTPGWKQCSFDQRCTKCGHRSHEYDALCTPDYAYLLGLYLGDGCISTYRRRVHRLRIRLDMRYPAIIASCAEAMLAVMGNRVQVQYFVGGGGAAEVGSYSRQWPCYFPQHGAGRKHLRRIGLEPWQQVIAETEPEALLRGLIHSDGCRSLNSIQGPGKIYRYPRYTFSNASSDIRDIFCAACDRLDIPWRQMNARNISVARRDGVARLDEFIGPKA